MEVLLWHHPWDSESGLKNVIGDAGVDFFRQYDRDMDGKLSLEEYEAMYYRLIGDGVNITANVQYTQLIDEDDEVLTARASFKPLLLETMTKDFNESFLSDSMDSLIGLKNGRLSLKSGTTMGPNILNRPSSQKTNSSLRK